MAMDALVRALTPYVGRICGSIALDRGDDAMQETFIAVRESVRQARAGDVVAEPVDRPAPDIDLTDAVDVRAALAELSPEHRAVLVLRDMDGLGEAEVAALLRIPEGTVKSRLHRARREFAGRWYR